MITRLEETHRAAHLFGDWQETIIWSCLQKVMGAIYADDMENPQSAMALLGDFCFFAGRPDKELVLYKPDSCNSDFIIMVPQNKNWADLIVKSYGDKAKAVTRYAIKKEKNIFDRQLLQAAAASLNPEYDMQLIDKKCFELCKANEWSRDLVSQFRDYEMYSRLGIGVVIFMDGKLVSGASAYARNRE